MKTIEYCSNSRKACRIEEAKTLRNSFFFFRNSTKHCLRGGICRKNGQNTEEMISKLYQQFDHLNTLHLSIYNFAIIKRTKLFIIAFAGASSHWFQVSFISGISMTCNMFINITFRCGKAHSKQQIITS